MTNNDRQRDRRLRRAMLVLLYEARGGSGDGWISGTMLRDLYGDQATRRERCADDDHQVRLLRDLKLKALVEERDERTRRHERFALDTLSFRITATGVSLIEESIDPDPDIDDERIIK